MYEIVSAWEQAAAQRAPQWLQGGLSARTRLGVIKEDLKFFGVQDRGVEQVTLPGMTLEAELLGSMYVMEGPTLVARSSRRM
ncbi:heme oxygenase [Granulicella aggregans]|uniref:Heme oxygenase n=1 Tax=Granulicella aggregans TaxID=474949 RepID=A0A7W7ZIA4_9BACT|nr:heme oxygenase [Granulicella aggregans]